MSMNEKVLTNALRILDEDDFRNKLLALMAPSGMKILDSAPDPHMEMEVAFWSAFTDVMLSPFEKDQHPRIIERYRAYINGILNDAAGLPMPKEETKQ